jgi:exodeoxyribonuclease VII large subunit
LNRSAKSRLALERERYRSAALCRFLVKPSLLVAERRVRVMNLGREMESGFKQFITRAQHRYAMAVSRLAGLNPLTLLKRGYIMATDSAGRVINSTAGLSQDQELTLCFADGKAVARVVNVKKESADAAS